MLEQNKETDPVCAVTDTAKEREMERGKTRRYHGAESRDVPCIPRRSK